MSPTKIQSRAVGKNEKMVLIRQLLADFSHHSPKMDGFFKGREGALFFDSIATEAARIR
jgi:hypothetical protein